MEISFKEVLGMIDRVYQGIQCLEIQPTKHNVAILNKAQGDLETISQAAQAMIQEINQRLEEQDAKNGAGQDGAGQDLQGNAQEDERGGSDAPEGETGKEKTEAPEEAKKAEKNGGER